MERKKEILEVIRRKGTIEILLLLKEGGKTYSEIIQKMGMSNGTAQRRLRELSDLSLVEANAMLTTDGRPTKRYTLAEDGRSLANTFQKRFGNL